MANKMGVTLNMFYKLMWMNLVVIEQDTLIWHMRIRFRHTEKKMKQNKDQVKGGTEIKHTVV